jgi:hypothetical protein
LKRNYRESDFAEEKKLLRLMPELLDETKKLISGTIKSDSAPISAMEKKERGKCKSVVKATAVNAYAGYGGDHDLRGNDLRFLMGRD